VVVECVASLRGLDSVVRSRDSVLAGAAAVEDRKEAGLAVAVTAGRPWLTDAN
jgi:hypothetical protein